MPGEKPKFGLEDLRRIVADQQNAKGEENEVPHADRVSTEQKVGQSTAENAEQSQEASADGDMSASTPESEAALAAESVHPEFRRRLEVDVDVDADKFFVEETAFKDSDGTFIPAGKAVEMFEDILVTDEQYPKEAVRYVHREHLRPIADRVNRLSREIKEAGENGENANEISELKSKRVLASNSLLTAMRSILTQPQVFLIDPEDFGKKKNELQLTSDDLLLKAAVDHPAVLHASGREVVPSAVRDGLNDVIETQVAQYAIETGVSSGEQRQVAGVLKQAFVTPLVDAYTEASRFNKNVERKEAIKARLNGIKDVEANTKTFLNFLRENPAAIEKLLKLHETRVDIDDLEHLAPVFPREFFRAPTSLKGDEHKIERRKFYAELVERYDDERLDALADAYKYPDSSEFTDMVIQDEAGYKPIMLRWAEARHLMRRAGLSEDHINHSFKTVFQPRFERLYEATVALNEERKKGSRIDRGKMQSIKQEMLDELFAMQGDMNKRLVNPRVYMMRNPLSEEEQAIDTVDVEGDLEIELNEDDMSFQVSDVYDPEERKTAFAVCKEAIMQYFNDVTAGMGDNAFTEVKDSDAYKNLEAAMVTLSKLVTRSIDSAEKDTEGAFRAAVAAASQDVEDALATFDSWFSTEFGEERM